jgi:probable phosphoglycerate mutase
MALALKALGIAGIVSSDLSRAVETATIVAERLGLGLAYVDADLRERSFGPFEGLTREECARLHPGEWRAWLAEQRAPEGAEARPDVTTRMLAAVARAAERVARENAPALVVTHGGSLRAAVATLTGTRPPPIRNGAVWRIEWDGAIVGAREL